jgi:hypothetical protein
VHVDGLMRSDVDVLPEPALDHDLCLLGRCEPFGIENLAACLTSVRVGLPDISAHGTD